MTVTTGENHQHYHCFLDGTRILTPDGEIPVEDLTIGALVETLNGPLPVKWIGHQSFRKDSPFWHWSVAPIRIARFALGDQYPVVICIFPLATAFLWMAFSFLFNGW